MTDYEFTTNPDERWAEIEASLSWNDCTRKQIKQTGEFFKTDPPEIEKSPWANLASAIKYIRFPTIKNMQLVVDAHIQKYGEVTQRDIGSLQMRVSKSNFHLNLEDSAYLF